VYALNAADGTLAWKFKTPYGLLFAGAVVSDGMVYVNAVSGLYALDAATGQVVWADSTILGEDASPAIADGIVYDPTNLGVIAYDAKTGHRVWQNSISVLSCDPTVANGVLYVSSYDGNLYAISASTGSVLWSYKLGITNYLSHPTVANGIVYVPGGTDQILAFGLPGMNGR
jgi:serine/threonine-protein kinase